MATRDEIARAEKRLEELKEKEKRRQQQIAVQFFKKNKIDKLLELPEELQKFINEVMPIIEKYKNE